MKTALLGFVSLVALGACATAEAPPAAPPQPAATPQPVAMTGAEAPSSFTRAEHATVKAERNFADARDFDFASRGFVATRKDPLITNAAGQTVWNLAAFDFLKEAAPETVNPSLWRQAPADGEARPVQGQRQYLAGARLRSRQHHLRQRQDRLDRHRHARLE